MKYTVSMTSDREHLKDLIMSDSKMSDMEKLHDVFCKEDNFGILYNENYDLS